MFIRRVYLQRSLSFVLICGNKNKNQVDKVFTGPETQMHPLEMYGICLFFNFEIGCLSLSSHRRQENKTISADFIHVSNKYVYFS